MAAIENGVALITGGARGMGEATVRLFASRGARLMIGDLNEERGTAFAEELRKTGVKAAFMKMDVTVEADVEAVVQATVAEYGRIDFAVNCAGLANKPALLADIPLDDYDRIVGINGRGVFLCMKHEIRAMLKNGGGAIVNISSGAGMGGLPQYSAYTAGKHACLGLTRTAALEYAEHNIRVNSVAPGVIDTALNVKGNFTDLLVTLVPMKRMGTTLEIAEACLWLCSDAASYITGQALGVCGGFNRVAASGSLPGPIGID